MESIILSATNFAVIPDGIPVLGGAGKISVPFLLFLGFEILWGGAKAISGAKMFLVNYHKKVMKLPNRQVLNPFFIFKIILTRLSNKGYT
jgi:hypothetical protein